MNNKLLVKYLFISLLLLGKYFISYAQNNNNSPAQHIIDSLKTVLKNQPDDTNKVNTLNKISLRFRRGGNFDSSIKYAKAAQELAEKKDFKNGLALAYKYLGTNYTHLGDYSKAFEYQSKSLYVCEQTGNKNGISSALGNIANIYFYQGNYSGALEYNFKALSMDEEIGDKKNVSYDFGNIGSIYYTMGNYPKALEYNFKALSISQEIADKEGIFFRTGNIGNIYHDLGNHSKALEYYFKALAMAREGGDKDAMARNLGNIGVTYSEESNYPMALDYYQQALTLHEETGNKKSTSINLDNIGNIYYDEGNYSKAMEYSSKALSIAREIGDKDETSAYSIDVGRLYIKQKNFKLAKTILDSALYFAMSTGDKVYIENSYAVLATLDSSTGNYKAGLEDYRKSVAYHDSTINKDGIKKTVQLEISYEFQKRIDSIRVVQEKTDIVKTAEIKKRDLITIGLIIISILFIILGIVLLNRQQLKHKKDRIAFEMEKQGMEYELANAKAILDEYTQNMLEKNKLLEQFKTDIESLKILKVKEIDETRIETLENLNKTTILTDEDWKKFRQLFSQVHHGFFIRLKEKMPELTQAEIRLLCLTKLKIDAKQMGGILGVSTESIRTSRYRLRKKLGLPEENRIDDIVNTI